MNDFMALDKENLPLHVAITMDGNGRWAQERKLPRTSGHDEGLRTAKRIVKAASDIGIKYLTLYVFSTENWKRAEQEVGFLMNLIHTHLCADNRGCMLPHLQCHRCLFAGAHRKRCIMAHRDGGWAAHRGGDK